MTESGVLVIWSVAWHYIINLTMTRQVGDDGSVLPATEDEVFQSLVEGSSAGLPPSYAGGSDVNEDDEDEERSDVSLDSDEDDSDGKEDPSCQCIF